MIWLRQSTASQEVPLGYFVDSTDGNTEETGLTIANTDIKLWKTGATTLANKNSGGGTHISNGIYYAVLDATDTDTIGPMVVFVHVSGALTLRLECCVLDEAVYDALFGTTALATATNITAAAGITLADNAVAAAKIATGAITAAKFAAGAIDAAAIADGAIDAATLAADTITAAKIATGAIDADAVAADAVAEIADGVWDEATAGHVAAGSFGKLSADVLEDTGTTLQGEVDGIQADTEDIQTRLPAALTAGGNMKSDALAISGDTVAADNLEAAADGTTFNLGGGAVVAASVTGAVGSVTGAVGSVTGNVGGNVTGSIGSLATQAKADVNAEALDVLNTDTFAEPGQEAPGATVSLVKKIGYLYKFLRNKLTQTATELKVFADDGTTVDQKATVSDDTTTYTRGEIGTGP